MSQPLFLLPGLICDETVWEPQRHALADVVVPSFWGLDSLAAMAAKVLAAAPLRFALAGHSMGARVALEIMRQAPQRVTRLALLDTGLHPSQPGEAERRQILVDIANTRGMAALAAAWLPPMVHPDRRADATLMIPLTAMVCRATPAIFAGHIRALLARPDLAPLLPAITCPTLVGVGSEDAWSPPHQHEAIAAAIPQARLVIFAHCGHMSPLEAPDAVTAALRDWLAA